MNNFLSELSSLSTNFNVEEKYETPLSLNGAPVWFKQREILRSGILLTTKLKEG